MDDLFISHCVNKCCTLYSNNTSERVDNWPDHTGYVAGVCVMDIKRKKVLLVKSCDKLSIPKGMVEHKELFITAALRELKEETGISATVADIIDNPVLTINYLDKCSVYYILFVDASKTQISLQQNDMEISGIGWFNLSCVMTPAMYAQLNRPTKIILVKIYKHSKL